MKFGGTSVADAERIKRAARRIVAKREAGNRVVAVLSARGKTTDELIAMAEEVSPAPDPREMDMLLSTGERISCALCAMAINDLGHEAISLTGSQAGIVTDTSHTKARILDVRADRIIEALDEDKIVLVAGFQGVSTSHDVTTLGRGGSDTTAVAVAAALDAEVCEIYTDVARRLQRRPAARSRRPQARRRVLRGDARDGGLRRRGAAAALGRIRTHARRPHPLPLELRGRARYRCGRRRRDDGTSSDHRSHPFDRRGADHARPACPTVLAPRRLIFTALAEAGVNVDTIIQNEPSSEGRAAEVSFTVPAEDLRVAEKALNRSRGPPSTASSTDRQIGKVSIVGAGMRSHPGVAAKVFQTLADEEINIEMISTSPIKISCVIRAEAVPRAVGRCIRAFELGEGGIQPGGRPR